jgi:hypothetical protein
VPVSDIDEFKGHIGCPFHRVFIPAGGAKTAMAAKRNKFHLSAVRAAIHGSTEGWIATIDHLVHVFDYGSTWMEDINHFFVMVCKDFLKDIHMNIIEEMDGKKKPHPSRLRGRGVEVSKTLCSDNEIIDQGLLFMGMNSWVSPTYLVAGRMIRPS